MNITWHGLSCIRIQESRQGGEVSLVTDPYAPESGKKLSRSFSADIVTVSADLPRHAESAAVSGAGEGTTSFVITGPGEYEVKDMFVTGIPTYLDVDDGKEKGMNTMYRFNAGGLHLVHLGALKHPLDEKYMEDFHDVDVLLVPVGGGDVLTAKQAAEVVNQIEPRIIIPMHYKHDGLGEELDGVEAFVKALGLARPEPVAKFKISSKELPQEEMKLVLLELQ